MGAPVRYGRRTLGFESYLLDELNVGLRAAVQLDLDLHSEHITAYQSMTQLQG